MSKSVFVKVAQAFLPVVLRTVVHGFPGVSSPRHLMIVAFQTRSKMARRITRRQDGFTLAEVLAAMLFMALVIPVAIQGLMIANRAGVVAERKAVAAGFADRLLTEMVLADAWQNAEDEGDFGEEYPDYTWTLTSDAWGEDTMLLLTVEVFYVAQGQRYSVRVSTLVEELADEEEGTEGTV